MSSLSMRDTLRHNLLEFTRTAFRVLPPIKNPSILDIGCGYGAQTIELAKMCNGYITAIDIDVKALEALRRKTEELGFSNRISIIELSMLDLNSFKETYDIIWAEGSIFVVGFERGICDWKQLISKNGFLVIHDQDNEVKTKLELIEKYEYEKLGQIDISHDEWWKRYYEPLVNLLEQEKLDGVSKRALQREIDTFKKSRMGSVFFILQKKS